MTNRKLMKAWNTLRKYCKKYDCCDDSCMFYDTELDICSITEDTPSNWKKFDIPEKTHDSI